MRGIYTLVLDGVKGDVATRFEACITTGRHAGAGVGDVLRRVKRQCARGLDGGRLADVGHVTQFVARAARCRLVDDAALRRCDGDIAAFDGSRCIHHITHRRDLERLAASNGAARVGQRAEAQIGSFSRDNGPLGDIAFGLGRKINHGREHHLAVHFGLHHPHNVVFESGLLLGRERLAVGQTQRLAFTGCRIHQALHLGTRILGALEQHIARLRNQLLLDQVSLITGITQAARQRIGVVAQQLGQVVRAHRGRPYLKTRVTLHQVLRTRFSGHHVQAVRIGRQGNADAAKRVATDAIGDVHRHK